MILGLVGCAWLVLFLRCGRGGEGKDPLFVRLVARSSFKIATCVFAPKKAYTSH